MIFPEKVDFRSLFGTYFELFKLDLGGDFHLTIIQVFHQLMKTDNFSEEDDCFSAFKNHDESFMKMLSDVLGNDLQLLPQ